MNPTFFCLYVMKQLHLIEYSHFHLAVVGFPVYISYGSMDTVVLPDWSEKTACRLELLGYNITKTSVTVVHA